MQQDSGNWNEISEGVYKKRSFKKWRYKKGLEKLVLYREKWKSHFQRTDNTCIPLLAYNYQLLKRRDIRWSKVWGYNRKLFLSLKQLMINSVFVHCTLFYLTSIYVILKHRIQTMTEIFPQDVMWTDQNTHHVTWAFRFDHCLKLNVHNML